MGCFSDVTLKSLNSLRYFFSLDLVYKYEEKVIAFVHIYLIIWKQHGLRKYVSTLKYRWS